MADNHIALFADNKCFGVYPEVVDNFDIAVNKCRSMGQNYDIASITNQLESSKSLSFYLFLSIFIFQKSQGILMYF